MSNQSIIGMVVFFGVALSLCLMGNLLVWRMVEQVNSKLPKAERFDFFWFYPGKLTKLKRLHAQFFPSSRLRLCSNIAVLAFLFSITFFFYLVSRK